MSKFVYAIAAILLVVNSCFAADIQIVERHYDEVTQLKADWPTLKAGVIALEGRLDGRVIIHSTTEIVLDRGETKQLATAAALLEAKRRGIGQIYVYWQTK
jgi:hypothetical protein